MLQCIIKIIKRVKRIECVMYIAFVNVTYPCGVDVSERIARPSHPIDRHRRGSMG